MLKALTYEKANGKPVYYKDWITKDWNSDVEVLEGVKLNLEKLLKEEGIEI